MKKPKQFLIYKIIGFTGIAFIITGIILLPIGIEKFYATHGDSYLDMFAAILIMAGLAMSIVGLVAGFSPEIAKLKAKGDKYIQQETKGDLSDIASTSADIHSEAITKTAKAIKEGLEEETIYCKHCGESIDVDSKFCKKCGKEQ